MKILLADDHELFLDGMRSILEKVQSIEVVKTATDGRDVMEYLRFNPVDVAVVDIDMTGGMGIELIHAIQLNRPLIKVLVLTANKQEMKVRQAIDAGVDGIVLKNSRSAIFLEAIQKISSGGRYFDQGLMDLLLKPKNPSNTGNSMSELTMREVEILTLIGQGKQSKSIADALMISTTTVDTHTRNIKSKLNLDNRLQLVLYAKENGYV